MSIPNLLTILRLFLMPVFLIAYNAPVEDSRIIAMCVFGFAFLTDVADGYIARNFNQITDLGKILDPVADKLMQVTVLICLAINIQRLLIVVVFIFIKDFLLGIGAAKMFKKKIVAKSNWFGKTACFVSMFASMVLLFPYAKPLSDTAINLWGALIVLVNAIAFISYTVEYIKCMKK